MEKPSESISPHISGFYKWFDPSSPPDPKRTVSSLPAFIAYTASLHILYKREVLRSGGIGFRPYNGLSRHTVREAQAFREPLDAFEILSAFLRVKTVDEALNFLRDTGQFLPAWEGQVSVQWDWFQRWQRIAEAMHLTKSREALLLPTLPRDLPDSLVAGEDLTEMHKIIRGDSRNTYFESAEWEGRLPDGFEEDPENSEADIAALRAEFSSGYRDRHRRRMEMVQQFIQPSPETYYIAWPRIENVTELRPWLVFEASCTLEAIAAAIFVERVGGTKFGKCPVCNELFPIKGQANKGTCGPKHQEVYKKQRQRGRS